MERDAIEVMAHGALVSTLELAIAPTFSTNWLLPRLPSFMEMHPQVLVNLTTRTRPFLFDETTLDAAIYAGEGSWPGTRGELLLPERLVVVGSPRLVGSGEGISPADIAGLPLIQLTTRPHAWRKWFNVHGLQVSNDMAGPRLDLYAMTAKAAMCGIGVALVPRFLVEDDLSRGHLVQLMAPITGDRAYYIVYPAEKAVSPALTAFKAWISEEARKDREAWDSAASR
jgi:LysR family glycine cleavage system transcriptional activator